MWTGRRRVYATRGFWGLLLAAAIVSPTAVLAAVLLAATVHEWGHLAALRYYGVPIRALRLGALGAELDAPMLARLSYFRELAVTLAGVAVNLLCALALALLSARLGWEVLALFAGAQLLLAAFNLLPILPLDGARALYLLTAYLFGLRAASTVTAVASVTLALTLAASGVYLSAVRHGGWLFAFSALALLWETLTQLGLAKAGKSV